MLQFKARDPFQDLEKTYKCCSHCLWSRLVPAAGGVQKGHREQDPGVRAHRRLGDLCGLPSGSAACQPRPGRRAGHRDAGQGVLMRQCRSVCNAAACPCFLLHFLCLNVQLSSAL